MSDPGLQRERTALAWTRTAAVSVVSALLLVRLGLHTGSRPLFLAAAAAAALSAVLVRRRGGLLAVTGLATATGALTLAGLLLTA
ncbi:protein of unknown function [Micromonospora coriariae]|uniref:DUF202 domain-containing protein n=1 Tax=Micromonospora coriariae TaxID=285665 RepID=A0A1C4U293_9ACTN|nr:DUF202 domain-containing protein [Micromonospora coriariae]SCE65727.1 protein of unknown function [Micromonospora coriariae]